MSSEASLQTVTIKITGMHCSSCAMNIDFELEDLDGVTEVTTHYASQKTKVTFNPQKTTVDQIIKIIESLDYKAEIYENSNV